MEVEGESFFVHCMKDADYVTKIMSTYGTLNEVETAQTSRRVKGTLGGEERVVFCYTELFEEYNKATHWVDDNNNRRHDPISISDAWQTKWWPHCQMAFLLGISEVNAVNAKARATKKPAEPQLIFRKKLALKMMTNQLLNDGSNPGSPRKLKRRSTIESTMMTHEFQTKPPFAGVWKGCRSTQVKPKYQKYGCLCGMQCCTYCKCNKCQPMCVACFDEHMLAL